MVSVHAPSVYKLCFVHHPHCFWTASCPLLMLEIIIWRTQENYCCLSCYRPCKSCFFLSQVFHGFEPYFSMTEYFNHYTEHAWHMQTKGRGVTSQKLGQYFNKGCILTNLLWAFECTILNSFQLEWISSIVHEKL